MSLSKWILLMIKFAISARIISCRPKEPSNPERVRSYANRKYSHWSFIGFLSLFDRIAISALSRCFILSPICFQDWICNAKILCWPSTFSILISLSSYLSQYDWEIAIFGRLLWGQWHYALTINWLPWILHVYWWWGLQLVQIDWFSLKEWSFHIFYGSIWVVIIRYS